MGFQLQQATKVQQHARIALVGPSGAGKTWTALEAAFALTGGDATKVAMLDTERGSGALYASHFGEFLHGTLDPPYTPDAYIDALNACVDSGAEVVIVDSLTHAWSGQGGILEQVDDYAAHQQGQAGKFGAWREATPAHNRLVDTLVRLPAHVIVTMRAKTAYEIDRNDQGQVEVKKLGLAPEQRQGLDYEFDVVGDVDREHRVVVSKSRCEVYADATQVKPDREWWQPLVDWLGQGEPVQQRLAARLTDLGMDESQQTLAVQQYDTDAAKPGDLSVQMASRMLDHLRNDATAQRLCHLVGADQPGEPQFPFDQGGGES